MRRSKYWYICVSHLPGWYFKSCNIGIVWFLQRCSFIVGKTFGFWSHRLFGKAFIKSVLLRNILFLHKKTLDPPFIKTVFLAFPLSVIIFFISVFWVFWEGQSSQLTRGGGGRTMVYHKKHPPLVSLGSSPFISFRIGIQKVTFPFLIVGRSIAEFSFFPPTSIY